MSLARLIMEQKRKDKISIRNERSDITTFSIDIKKIIRNTMNNLIATNWTTQMNKICVRYKSSLKKIDNLNTSMSTKKIIFLA